VLRRVKDIPGTKDPGKPPNEKEQAEAHLDRSDSEGVDEWLETDDGDDTIIDIPDQTQVKELELADKIEKAIAQEQSSGHGLRRGMTMKSLSSGAASTVALEESADEEDIDAETAEAARDDEDFEAMQHPRMGAVAGRDEFDSELEFNMTEPPFASIALYRMTKSQKTGNTIKKKVGTLKCRIRVFTKAQDQAGVIEPVRDLKQLYRTREVVVRLYVLQGYQLVPKDSDGGNDPFLAVEIEKPSGRKKRKNEQYRIEDTDHAKQMTSRPDFYRSYEFHATFPQQNKVTPEFVGVFFWFGLVFPLSNTYITAALGRVLGLRQVLVERSHWRHGDRTGEPYVCDRVARPLVVAQEAR
jgi:hypothetical protein